MEHFKKLLLHLFAILIFTQVGAQTTWHTNNGSQAGTGTREDPFGKAFLTTKTDLSGDTVLLLDGVYEGHHDWHVYGTPGNPVVLKSENWLGAKFKGTKYNPGEDHDVLRMWGQYSYIVGVEIFDNAENGNRISNNGQEFYWSDGLELRGHGQKAINNVIHDVLIGVSSWSDNIGGEFYGNIIYNVGWNNELSSRGNHGHGHGGYLQNDAAAVARKIFRNNFISSVASEGIQIYSQDKNTFGRKGKINNWTVDRNTIFNLAGLNLTHNPERAIIIGGYVGAQNITLTNNRVYKESVQVGYSVGAHLDDALTWEVEDSDGLIAKSPDQWRFEGVSHNLLMADNYFWGTTSLKYCRSFRSISGNTFIPSGSSILTVFEFGPERVENYPVSGNDFYLKNNVGVLRWISNTGTDAMTLEQLGWNENTFISELPKSNRIFIENNVYDPTMTAVTILNHAGSDTISIDLDGFVNQGDTLEIRDIQNPLQVVASEVYKGKIDLNMNLTKITKPFGNLPSDHYKHTDNEFGVFLIRKVNKFSIPDTGGGQGNPKDSVVIISPTYNFDSAFNQIQFRINELEKQILINRDSIKNHRIIIQQ